MILGWRGGRGETLRQRTLAFPSTPRAVKDTAPASMGDLGAVWQSTVSRVYDQYCRMCLMDVAAVMLPEYSSVIP